MERPFLVALTGTPGTGKSELLRRLGRWGALCFEATELARRAKAIGRMDHARDSFEVDVAKVSKWWTANRTRLSQGASTERTRGGRHGRRGATDRPKRVAGGRVPLERALIVVAGHWSHDLPADGVLVLRASPRALRRRLAKRRYRDAKVQENVEAEAMDLILQEAIASAERRGIPVGEIITSNRSPAEVARDAAACLNGGWKRFAPGKADWSGELLR